MKKTLLSVLAVVSVMGTASAVPSAADRKAMCESKPDKYVWVEKNQACIPVNPCGPMEDSNIKNAYCLQSGFNGTPDFVKNGISGWELLEFDLEYNNRNCRLAKEKVFKSRVMGGLGSPVSQIIVPCVGDGTYFAYAFWPDNTDDLLDNLCFIGGFRARVTYEGWTTRCEKR